MTYNVFCLKGAKRLQTLWGLMGPKPNASLLSPPRRGEAVILDPARDPLEIKTNIKLLTGKN